MKLRAVSFLLFAGLYTTSILAQAPAKADAIYYNGNILTGVDLTGSHPQRVTAIAVGRGAIIGAGEAAAIGAQFKSASTQMIDLHGAFVIPGFNDAHAHLGDAGQIKLSVDLTGCGSLVEM